MHFTRFLAIAASATAAYGQMSANQLVIDINTITRISSETKDIASSISFTNFFRTAPQLVNNFQVIITKVTSDVSSLGDPSDGAKIKKRQDAPPYDEGNQQAICDAFRDFVIVHQQLLAVVIGKQGLLAQTPFTAPLAIVLRTLEGGVDTLAFGIIDAVPFCAGETQDNKDQIDRSLQEAVDAYN